MDNVDEVEYVEVKSLTQRGYPIAFGRGQSVF